MAGSISLSLSQQFDSTGAPLNGGLLYFYAAGTTTPQSAYQDYSLTIPYPNPMVLDSAGRIPAFYLADGQIKVVLKDSAGVTQVSADNLLVVGASAGTGTPPTVDATTVFSTGDIKARYDTSAITGWVRSNGRTVGNASSGGTERANADTEDLFVFLYNLDSALSVSGGRGANAAADYAANKTIALPDFRGRVIAGFDDMGNSAASRLTATTMTGTGIGATGGTQTHVLTEAQMPVHDHGVTDPGHLHQVRYTATSIATGGGSAGLPSAAGLSGANSDSATTGITVNNAGSGDAHLNVQPTMFATIYIKL
jgi:microcystin-dependent protein